MRKSRRAALLAGLLGVAGVAAPAWADGEQSAYTDINLDECLVMHTHELGVDYACSGYKGMPVYVAEDDLRFFVSYGWYAPDEMAAHQTLPNFNYINTRLEWRMSNESGAWRPFATILRWIIDTGSEPDADLNGKSVLVVTRIEEGNTCHVAYIDSWLVADANAEARRWADTLARDFDCENDQPVQVPS